MSKSTKTSPPEPESIFQTLTDVQTAGLGSLTWLGKKWGETLGEVGAEWLSFVADRVREDVRTQHELLHAKNAADMQSIQAQFLQKALDDYGEESGKIVEFCSNAMTEIQNHASKKVDITKT